jgi:hypothetical protein
VNQNRPNWNQDWARITPTGGLVAREEGWLAARRIATNWEYRLKSHLALAGRKTESQRMRLLQVPITNRAYQMQLELQRFVRLMNSTNQVLMQLARL